MKAATKTNLPVNETLQIIYTRRSVRKYKETAVAKELIEQIIDAGRMAPSAINRQPWKFYVLNNKIRILSFSAEIAKVVEQSHPLAHGVNPPPAGDFVFHGAPVVIFITAPKDNEWAGLDIGMCAQNMMLAAKSMGLDTCPVGLGKFVEQTSIFSELKVTDTEKIMLAVILGYGDEQVELKERRLDNVLFVK